jgi:hypothetical protein
VPAEVSKSIETEDPTVPSPFLNINDLKFVADDPAIDNLEAGVLVPMPTLPLSNIDPVATVEADENLTT